MRKISMVNRADKRSNMVRWLRGGPPWTTKLRIVVVMPLAIAVVIVGGACHGAFEYLVELASECREAWMTCDREIVRRLEKNGSDEP